MEILIILFIYCALTALGAYLTELCLRRWGKTAARSACARRFWIPAYILLSLIPPAGAFLPDGGARYRAMAAGNVYLGFFVYFGGLLLILCSLAGLYERLSRRRCGKRLYGRILCLSMAASLAVNVYGLVHAQRPVIVRYECAVDKPCEGLEELKLVLISDLHLSVNSHIETTRRMVEMINEEVPDVVAVAGDIFTSTYHGLAEPEAYAETLSGIRARYGVYAVYGNHDVEEPLIGGFGYWPAARVFRPAEMVEFMGACGFTMLEDETATLPGGIQLAGRIDKRKPGDGTGDRMTAAELLADVPRDRPVIVMEHEPVEYRELSLAGADVVFSGHTHNGQIFPGNLIAAILDENSWGHARLYGMDTFVTAGVGYYGPPLRVGTNSEITVIHFTFGGGKAHD